MNDARTEGVSFAVQSTTSRPRNLNSNLNFRGPIVCSTCGRNGHTTETCFRRIGYPPWYEEKPRNTNPHGASRGNQTQGRGTSTRALGSQKSKPIVAAQAHQVTTYRGESSSGLSSSDREGMIGLTDLQWESLKQMLDAHPPPPSDSRLSGPHYSDADWSG